MAHSTICAPLGAAAALLAALSCSDSHYSASLPAAVESVATTSEPLSTTSADFSAFPSGLGLAISAGDANPWLVGTDNNLYTLTGNMGSRGWAFANPNPSTLTSRVAVSPEGTVWRVDSGGVVQRLSVNACGGTVDGGQQKAWQTLSGHLANDIGVGSGNQAWIIGTDSIGNDFHVYSWTEGTCSWTQEANSGGVRIAVSPEGIPWLTNNANQIWTRQSPGTWVQPASTARAIAIAVAPNNVAWVIGTNNAAFAWNGSFFAQTSTAFPMKEISLGADGTPWALGSGSANNQILRWRAPWTFLGPRGFNAAGSITSGVVQDIDASDLSNNRLVVATGGGGVWVANTSSSTWAWTPIADTGYSAGPAPAVASVSQLIGDPAKTLMVATGVFTGNDIGAQQGNGIWKGHQVSGVFQWTQSTCSGCTFPNTFARIRYNKFDATHVYAVSPAVSPGLFVSTDGGNTFSQTTAQLGFISDLDIDANGHIYVGTGDGGVATSTEDASSFLVSHPAGVLSSTQYTKLSVVQGDTSTIYASIAGNDGFHGVFKGTNRTFSNVTWTATGLGYCGGSPLNSNLMGAQGGHDGAIASISGTTVIAAGVGAWRTTDGGGGPFNGSASCPGVSSDWTQSAHTAFHGDITALASSGSNVFVGNDGGIAASSDFGQSWSLANNTIPVMQEYGVSVSGDTILAAAWDVGVHQSLDHGTTWSGAGLPDAKAVRFVSSSEWYEINYESNPQPQGGTTYNAHKRTGQGGSWGNATLVGMAPASFADAIDYSDSSGRTYASGTGAWQGVNYLNNGSGTVAPYAQSQGQMPSAPTAVVSAVFRGSLCAPQGTCGTYVIAGAFSDGGSFGSPFHNLWMSKDGGAWVEVGGTQLPAGGHAPCTTSSICAIKQDYGTGDLGPNIYVLAGGGRVFVDNLADIVFNASLQPNGASIHWVELTGNLPSNNVAFYDIVGDPARGTVVVGSSVGAFKTTNACVTTTIETGTRAPCWTTTWQPWGEGLPLSPASVPSPVSVGTTVSRLDAQTRSDGHFYVYAATWERGIWVRDATADDP